MDARHEKSEENPEKTRWRTFLSNRGAQFTAGKLTHFGDQEDELLAAKTATILAPLSDFGLLTCTGADAKSFLQNQLTSDVNSLTENAFQYSSLCTPKGRMLANFLLFREAQSYRLLLSADLADAIQKHLKIYVFRSQVALENSSANYEFLGLAGKYSAQTLEKAGWKPPTRAHEMTFFPNGFILRLDESRFIVGAPPSILTDVWEKLAETARPVGENVWQWLAIQAGIVLITQATREAFIPQMIDFDKIGGVSFTKGCYPGQEIVARTRYLGKIKRHLYRLKLSHFVASGTAIYALENSDSACGMIAHCAASPANSLGGYEALAVIQEDAENAGLPKANLVVDSALILAIERVLWDA